MLTLALQKTDRGNRSCPTSSTQNPRLNPHSIRGTASAPLPAISCLGAFRTPVAGARGWHPMPASENLHMKRREQVQRNCQCASTSRQKTHQAKADRAPRFRQCLIIAPRSSTCRVELHWRLGPGADHGRMARIAEAWDRSTAPGATSRSTIPSASIRLQRLRLACRSGAQLIPILATRYGWARPGHACLWTDILNPL